MFATGIENSYPTILLPDGKEKRVDSMEKTCHYQNWKLDFDLVKSLGIEFLRYGVPYYKTHVGPGKYDWSFADDAFQYLNELGITPIVDLCHFGVPDWLGNFQNAQWPEYFAQYAEAFAKRYPWLKYYTPVNEIYIAAKYSAHYGWWNERKTSDRDCVTCIKHLCRANVLAMQAILKAQSKAVFIQSESTEYYHAEEPSCFQQTDFLNEKRFLSLDLIYGYPVSVTMYKFLMKNGMTDREYEWFQNNVVKAPCIMGNDYYHTNEHVVHTDGIATGVGEILGYYGITNQYFRRYRLPVMHTETNMFEGDAPAWLRKQWCNVYQLKQDGVPVIGFTWYSLIDQKDWDTKLREDNGRVNELGLFDLNRTIRPVGEEYRTLMQQWKGVLNDETLGMHVTY